MSKEKAVLIAGGYGIVGEQMAGLLRERNPNQPIIIAGRDKAKADAVAKRIGKAKGVALDVTRQGSVAALAGEISAVVTAVNDSHNHILVETVRAGIPYVDITRWTALQRKAVLRASLETITAPVVFSSSWMAGVAALVAKKLAEGFSRIHEVNIDILYSLKDKAGPNSIEYVDQLGTPYDVFKDDEIVSVKPMTEPRMVSFPGGIETKTYRFDTPDQMTLPVTLGANSVSARIAYDDKSSAAFLAFLVRVGIWSILNRPAFTKVRRGLLYNPGEGGSQEIVVEMTGTDTKGQPCKTSASIVDQAGQTHLTALGGVIQIERVLGLNGATGAPSGITFPEKHEDIDLALSILKAGGVNVSFQA